MTWIQADIVTAVIVIGGVFAVMVGAIVVIRRDAKVDRATWTHYESYLDAGEHPKFDRENKE